jgi:hypothetical protein
LFHGFTDNVRQGGTIDHPSLFELQATISIHDNALKHSFARFSKPISLPTIPGEGNGNQFDPFTKAILKGIFDVQLEMPYYYFPHEVEVPQSSYSSINSLLEAWIIEALSIMQSKASFVNGSYPKDYLLKIVRALGYLYGADPKRFVDGISLYERCYLILAAHCIHRYMCGVIQKIASDLIVETGKRQKWVKGLAHSFSKLISTWNVYAESEFPEVLKVSLTLVFTLSNVNCV